MRPVIYQLFVRHFSNFRESGVDWGTLEQNGCGTFRGITDKALLELASMGVTHVWLTGVLRQATQASFPGLPAQPPCIVKGLEGSPYAVTDMFDVSPELAVEQSERLNEFEDLVFRCRRAGLVPMIDLVPNHVSRGYAPVSASSPTLGAEDDFSLFCGRENAFFYLQRGAAGGGPPMRLPDGEYAPEAVHGRVTGNNAATWTPSRYDWYETVKLNYGANYELGAAAMDQLPGWLSRRCETPRTWQFMDDMIAYWQKQGVGGFRCDMAHMVPMHFWKWAISRARVRDAAVFFMAEAYNDDMRTTSDDVLPALLEAGFAGVYDADCYHHSHGLYDAGAWANDFDRLNGNESRLFGGGVRYVENHDEPRMCSPQHWGGVGEQVEEGVMTAVFAASKGPVLVYNGQEVGERAEGPSGYGGRDGRTSIFDYTCLPRLARWTNGGAYDGARLSPGEREMRSMHKNLLSLLNHPALKDGVFYGLNWANMQNETFGRAPGEEASGHWVYAFLRHHWEDASTLLVVCNLSPSLDFNDLRIHIPRQAQEWAGKGRGDYLFRDLLHKGAGAIPGSADMLATDGLHLPLKAGKAVILDWTVVRP